MRGRDLPVDEVPPQNEHPPLEGGGSRYSRLRDPFVVPTTLDTFVNVLERRKGALSTGIDAPPVTRISAPISLRSVVATTRPPAQPLRTLHHPPSALSPEDSQTAMKLLLDIERRTARLEDTLGSSPFLPHPALHIPTTLSRLEARAASVYEDDINRPRNRAVELGRDLRSLVRLFESLNQGSPKKGSSSPTGGAVSTAAGTPPASDDALFTADSEGGGVLGSSGASLAARVDRLYPACRGFDVNSDTVPLLIQRLSTLKGVVDGAVHTHDCVDTLLHCRQRIEDALEGGMYCAAEVEERAADEEVEVIEAAANDTAAAVDAVVSALKAKAQRRRG